MRSALLVATGGPPQTVRTHVHDDVVVAVGVDRAQVLAVVQPVGQGQQRGQDVGVGGGLRRGCWEGCRRDEHERGGDDGDDGATCSPPRAALGPPVARRRGRRHPSLLRCVWGRSPAARRVVVAFREKETERGKERSSFWFLPLCARARHKKRSMCVAAYVFGCAGACVCVCVRSQTAEEEKARQKERAASGPRARLPIARARRRRPDASTRRQPEPC